MVSGCQGKFASSYNYTVRRRGGGGGGGGGREGIHTNAPYSIETERAVKLFKKSSETNLLNVEYR